MKFYKLMLCAIAICGAVACSDDSFEGGQSLNTGYLSFEMEASGDVEHLTRADISIATAAGEDYTAPADGDFTIVINEWDSKSEEKGDEIYNGLLSGWSATTPLMAGEYVVKATYSAAAATTSSGNVGFNLPVFESEEVKFTIVGATTTTVQIPVSLKNAIVRLVFTDMFNNYYSYEKFSITSANTTVELPKDDSRGIFIEVGEFSIASTLTSQAQTPETDDEGNETGDFTNKSIDFSKKYTAASGKCYTITFDAANVGGIKITITFGDEPSETIDKGDIDLNGGSNSNQTDNNSSDQNS